MRKFLYPKTLPCTKRQNSQKGPSGRLVTPSDFPILIMSPGSP